MEVWYVQVLVCVRRAGMLLLLFFRGSIVLGVVDPVWSSSRILLSPSLSDLLVFFAPRADYHLAGL